MPRFVSVAEANVELDSHLYRNGDWNAREILYGSHQKHVIDPSKSRLLSLPSILQEPETPVEWDLVNLIVHGDRAVFYGEWGSYKSFLLYHLALHLAAGKEWLGWKIPTARRVLYVDEEMNLSTVKRRFRRLMAGMGESPADLPLQLLSRVGLHFSDQSAWTLLRCLDRWNFQPDIVVIESMRRVMLGDENHAADVARFWSNLGPLLERGWSVYVSHHMSKPNPERPQALRHRQSGSTDIIAGVDCALAVTRQGKSHAADVTQVKQREGEEAGTFTFLVESSGDVRTGPITLRRDSTFQRQENPWTVETSTPKPPMLER